MLDKCSATELFSLFLMGDHGEESWWSGNPAVLGEAE